MNNKIAFGGGCHWCTEAVFQALKGVQKVEQGFIASTKDHTTFSEAVIVHYNPEIITLDILIQIHLYTHKSTSNHSMRTKYRSAIYYFSEEQKEDSAVLLANLQSEFEAPIITKTLPFKDFKPSEAQFKNYYKNNPNKPFCQTYINPKLKLLQAKFSKHLTDNLQRKSIS
ncbi:peptide-methionine (S)-S-oxide reductase [Olleya sp. 1-3]|uniref:peptide-methionine (S)-S-oxide reductase n=1 Tax=Olleya sp. 1-3 TaxID=2058323 RepID=UPI000C32ACB5|nr:peptide-methionine (S)-S-oxide reductase [Olleya sp. 1-3]PKG52364.1 peptide methionine sulfoxide reductase [Olleya sp. 1-3]